MNKKQYSLMLVLSAVAGLVFGVMLSRFFIGEFVFAQNAPQHIEIETTTTSWWLQSVTTIAAAVFGALIAAVIVVWQMGKQHRNSLKLQKSNMRAQLHLEIYKEFAEKIEACSNALSTATSKIGGLPSKLSTRRRLQSMLHSEVMPIEDRAHSIADVHQNATKHIGFLITAMEKYEIVIPDFRTFISHFVRQSMSFCNTFSSFYREALLFLPTDVLEDKDSEVGTKVIVPAYPVDKKIEKLKVLGDEYYGEGLDFQAYITDLRIALQNRLLGSLFDHKLPPRKPGDPNMFVIDIEKDTICRTEPSKEGGERNEPQIDIECARRTL